MENFAGSALTGTCFIVIAIWHTIRIFQRYYVCREAGAKFSSSLTFPCPCLGNRMKYRPVEAYVKMLIGTIGFSVEMIRGFQNGHLANVGSVQNATMFLLFGVTGVMDLMVSMKTSIPEHVDYFSNVLAFGMYGFLVKCSPQRLPPLDGLLHTLLAYAIFSTVLTLLAEMRYRHNVWSSLARSWTVLCQGTWLWQMGFVQHHPFSSVSSWDHYSHDHMAVVVMIFTWHVGFNFVLVLTIGSLVALRYRHYPSKTSYRVKDKLEDNMVSNENSDSESALNISHLGHSSV
ncbi:transmembrane protein 45B-like [Gigantopelta aegis]|uniref:transmembrane protein 45B-like n=1 Tax=Gigantopelta aegis TaxID=1735272 RepID=UPI001B88786A|nr:transmembrane protein 45B-like [Gigantopelta aegis]